MEKRTIEITANIETGEVEIYLENWSSNQNAINALKNVIAKLEETGGEKVTVIISDSPEKESTLEDLRQPAEEMYYIQNASSISQYALWARGKFKFSIDLEKAKKYTKREAVKINDGFRFLAWPCKYIDENEAAREILINTDFLNMDDSKK